MWKQVLKIERYDPNTGELFVMIDGKEVSLSKKTLMDDQAEWVVTADDGFSSVFNTVLPSKSLFGSDVNLVKQEYFSKECVQTVLDYARANSFFSQAQLTDVLKDVFRYRLGFSLSQEKGCNRLSLQKFCHDVNAAFLAFEPTHPRYFLEHLEPKPNDKADTLRFHCKFYRIDIRYEPDLTTFDWEQRYKALKQKHGL